MAGMHSGFGLVWIASPGSLKDAVWFWNIRALMPQSFARAPVAIMTTRAARDPEVRTALEDLKSRPKWTTPDIFVVGLSSGRRDLEAAAHALGLEVARSGRVSFHLGQERDPAAPLTAELQVDPRRHLLGERTVGLRAAGLHTIERPSTTIRQTSPVKWARGSVGGHVIARWTAPFMRVPRRPAVAKLFSPNGQWKYGGLELETDAVPLYHLSVAVPSPESVLRAAVSDAGVQFEPSQPGRLAQAVLQRVERDQMIFADRAVQQVVRALTTPRSKHLAKLIVDESPEVSIEAAAVIADRIGFRLSQVALSCESIASRSGLPASKVGEVAERLVAAGLADRGFVVDCVRCGLIPFVQATSSTRRGRCPACRAPSGYARDANNAPAVHYRLNALLDRASDQGVVPHLAVLQRLAPDPGASCFVLGAHLLRGDDALGEVDLLGYDGERLLCGEVKTSAAGFTPEEIARAVRLAIAANCDDLVFGCTDQLDQSLVNDLFASAPNGKRVRVVTAENVLFEPLPPTAVAGPLE